ncbi:MAG: hypothetical protein ACKOZW_01625 [Cyanobium sp.]
MGLAVLCGLAVGLNRAHHGSVPHPNRLRDPQPLGMPLQFMVTVEAVARGHHYPEQAKDVNFNPVGQIVGTMNKVRRSKDVIMEMVEEYLEATSRLESLNAAAAS